MTDNLRTLYFCTVCKRSAESPNFEVESKSDLLEHVEHNHDSSRWPRQMGTRTVDEDDDREPDVVTNPRNRMNHVLREWDGQVAFADCGARLNVLEKFLGRFPVENDGDRCKSCTWPG